MRAGASKLSLPRPATDFIDRRNRNSCFRSPLTQLNKTWQATLQSAKQPDTPPPVLQSVQSVVDSVERTRQAAESVLAHVLTLQGRLSEEEARVRTVLSSIEQVEIRSLETLFARDRPPIWNLETSLGTEWEKQSGEPFSSQLKASTAFLGPTTSARGDSATVGQVHISRPNAGLHCLSCLGASELAFTNRNC
jgi:hypothetical protein